MINSECSGVAFSRHPLKPMTSTCSYIEAVYGQGEGLVGGQLLADGYEVRNKATVSRQQVKFSVCVKVSRRSLEVTSTVAEKDEMFVQAPDGGVVKVSGVSNVKY